MIGQIIDYAKDLSAWSYEQLDAAVRKTRIRAEFAGENSAKLYELAAMGHPEINEARFIDTVSRNLKRGRILLLIVGDGIQQGTENITTFLQQHAGLHFTLALVEMAIFEIPGDTAGYLVQPRIIARTTNIDRGIVTVEDGRITVRPPQVDERELATSRRISISEERFYEELATNRPHVVGRLKSFIERLSSLGVSPELGTKSLILRWRPDEDRAWNLGAIVTDGKVWTDILQSQANAVGLLDLSHAYVERLAAAIPGAYVKKVKPLSWHVDKDGTYILVDDLLAHEETWYAAIVEFTAAATEALKNQ